MSGLPSLRCAAASPIPRSPALSRPPALKGGLFVNTPFLASRTRRERMSNEASAHRKSSSSLRLSPVWRAREAMGSRCQFRDWADAERRRSSSPAAKRLSRRGPAGGSRRVETGLNAIGSPTPMRQKAPKWTSTALRDPAGARNIRRITHFVGVTGGFQGGRSCGTASINSFSAFRKARLATSAPL